MSIEINSIIIGGNLTRDVVFKEIAAGRQVASFNVATNRTFLSNGEKKRETTFIDVDVWGKPADNCRQYLKKGSPVVVVGRLKQEQWTADNGDKKSRFKVVAVNVQFLPSGQKGNGKTESSSSKVTAEASWGE